MFLHHPGLRCLLPPASRIDLFGLDGAESHSGLPGISERLLEPATPQQSVGANRDQIIASLMERIGIVLAAPARGGLVGDRRGAARGGRRLAGLAGVPPGGHDRPGPDPVPGYPAGCDVHRAGQGPPGRRARVPDHVAAGATTGCCARGTWWTANSASAWSTRSTTGSSGSTCGWPTTRAARRRPRQLSLLRQVAEAVAYAHGNRVVHRGLTPHAVLVHRQADGELRVLVGDWQSAGTVAGPALTGLSGSGVTGLMGSGRRRRPGGQR